MLYKFRSLAEPDLSVDIRTTDGDWVKVNFVPYHPVGRKPFGLYETEINRIGQGMLNDKRNGVLWMDENYVPEITTPKPEPVTPVKSEPKPKTVAVPAPKQKPKSKKNR